MIGAPPGSIDFYSASGYTNAAIFNEWLRFFVKEVQPCADFPILLILDDHVSHITLDCITYACEHHPHLLSLPRAGLRGAEGAVCPRRHYFRAAKFEFRM